MTWYKCPVAWGICPKKKQPGPHSCQKRWPNREHRHVCKYCKAESPFVSLPGETPIPEAA